MIIDIRGNGGGATAYWQENIIKPLLKEKIEATFYVAFRNGAYSEPFVNYLFQQSPGSFGNELTFSELPQNNKSYPPELKNQFKTIIENKITIKPDNSVGFNGKIFLLVDEGVYSASEAFAAFSKATDWAVLVGTVTGGDGIGPDPLIVALPNSGLLVRFPGEMSLNPDGSSNEEMKTVPDVLINPGEEDALEKALEIIQEKRSH